MLRLSTKSLSVAALALTLAVGVAAGGTSQDAAAQSTTSSGLSTSKMGRTVTTGAALTMRDALQRLHALNYRRVQEIEQEKNGAFKAEVVDENGMERDLCVQPDGTVSEGDCED